MLRRSVGALLLALLAGCQSSDFGAKDIAKSFKGSIDWVRDAFGQPVAKVSRDAPAPAFPDYPNDPRPLARSLKARTDMIAALGADHATAEKIEAALAKSDPTQYLLLNGAKPTAQPIALAAETIELPAGVRDIDSFDPSRAGNWAELGRIEFAEGSAALPEGESEGLRRAAQLVREAGTLRVVGYSGSERVGMEGRGAHETNRYLADLRARRVAEQLVAFGAPPRQLLVGPAPEAVRAGADKVEIIIDY
jgi:outer membrane protein OmpA-like peptidoglycan-associated protein